MVLPFSADSAGDLLRLRLAPGEVMASSRSILGRRGQQESPFLSPLTFQPSIAPSHPLFFQGISLFHPTSQEAMLCAPTPTCSSASFGVYFLLLAFVPLASAVSFDFARFDRETKLTCSAGGKGICLQGDAFPNRGLQLTKNQLDGPITSSVGRAVYSEPVHIWDASTRRVASFTTRFSFLIHDVNPRNQSGDGLAFILSPYPSLIPDNSSGGFLGLFSSSSLDGAVRSGVVAVEFDTYRNREWDSSSGDHIGIDVDSIQSAAELPLEGGIKKKAIAHVLIVYNASSQTLGVSLSYGEEPFRNQGSFSISHVVDLGEVLSEEYVAVGFSAATGSCVETHTILSWSFHATLDTKKIRYIWLVEMALLVAATLTGGTGLAWSSVWMKKAAMVQESQDIDLYSPLCMGERGGWKGDGLTVRAEPREEKAGWGKANLDIEVDASAIKKEGRPKDSESKTAEMVSSGGAGDKQDVTVDAGLEGEGEGEGGDGDGDGDSSLDAGNVAGAGCTDAQLAMKRPWDDVASVCSSSTQAGDDCYTVEVERGVGAGNGEEDEEYMEEEEEEVSLGVEEGRRSGSEVMAALEFLGKTSPEEIPYQALVMATGNFSEDRRLGRGGFGEVYRGYLHEWGVDVAIKKLSDESIQGIKEYVSEVKIISQLRHRNLVKLIGWCHEQGKFLLVYEFMSKGSLDRHLFEGDTLLSWPIRDKIILGVASALLYLHEECEQYVVHRDVKASNVLLDESFDAKLGDFGLARLFNHNDISCLEVTQLAGTCGYMAPEYALFGKASRGSDVYSFGVLALEIACGLKTIQDVRTSAEEGGSGTMLVEGVWKLYGRGSILEAADRRLNGNFDRGQMERLLVVGLWGAHPDVSQRPSISQARRALLYPETVPLPHLPTKMPPWAHPLASGPAEAPPQMYKPSPPSGSASQKKSRSPLTRFIWWWRSRKTRNPRQITDDQIRIETDQIRMVTGMREFSYGDLRRATGGFATDRRLGGSDYWVMYKATLKSGEDVVVKRFLHPHGQGKQRYVGEMMTLSHLSHKNLLKLIGLCHEGDEFLVVIEYFPNGSLDRHLFYGSQTQTIPWHVRYKVAIGLASALCYLHDWGLCILHRDIKPENVILDNEFNAKLCGFDLSRVVDHDLSSMYSNIFAGTMGYMAPECAFSGRYTKESDVYSFGAVALAIACGRKVIDNARPEQEEHLLRWVEKCHQEDRLLRPVDPKLRGTFHKEEMERLLLVGLWCTNFEPAYRPQMASVLRALQFKESPPARPSARRTTPKPDTAESDSSGIRTAAVSPSSSDCE